MVDRQITGTQNPGDVDEFSVPWATKGGIPWIMKLIRLR